MRPIWKDYNIYPGGTYNYTFHYYITESGSTAVLYEGRADKLPNDLFSYRANTLCAPFLSMKFYTETGTYSHPEALKTFVFSDADLGDLEPVDSVEFLYDWSYEDKEYGYDILSKPINGHMDPRMNFYITVLNTTNGTIEINE